MPLRPFACCRFAALFLGMMGLTGAAMAAGKAPDLCAAGDHVYFSCQTQKHKIISLCGRGAAEKPDYLYYRFGKQGALELEFPASKDAASLQKFSYLHYFRYQTDYAWVVFKNGRYRYAIYNLYSGDDPEQSQPRIDYGLNVSLAKDISDDPVAEHACVGPVISELPPLEAVLGCDADDIGCASERERH